MGQARLIGGIFMVMLFTVAILTYAVNFGNDNNSGTRLDDLDNNLVDLNTQIASNISSDAYLEVDDASEGFFESSLPQSASSLDTTTVTGGQFKTILSTPLGSIKTIFRAINKNIFGDSVAFGVITTGLISFLIILGILYIWKTWKGGNPN